MNYSFGRWGLVCAECEPFEKYGASHYGKYQCTVCGREMKDGDGWKKVKQNG